MSCFASQTTDTVMASSEGTAMSQATQETEISLCEGPRSRPFGNPRHWWGVLFTDPATLVTDASPTSLSSGPRHPLGLFWLSLKRIFPNPKVQRFYGPAALCSLSEATKALKSLEKYVQVALWRLTGCSTHSPPMLRLRGAIRSPVKRSIIA